MATAPTAAPPARPSAAARGVPWLGLGVAALIVTASILLPFLFGWDTETRRDDRVQFPPLHGFWDPKIVPLSALGIAVALLGWRYAERVAARLPWRTLLLTCFAVGSLWLVALALVDGEPGLTRVLGNPYEYLETAREVDDVGVMLSTFVDRMPYGLDDAWVTHVAGHPPGALLFFVGLVRIGLGGDLAAALVVTALAATTAPAVLVTLRALGAEQVARRAAPFLVLTPAAVFMAVSADAMFAAVAAWGLACLALAARAATAVVAALSSPGRWPPACCSGACVMLSYGLPLLGLLALAVLWAARSWRPLPVAAGAAWRWCSASRWPASRGGRPTRCSWTATRRASPASALSGTGSGATWVPC